MARWSVDRRLSELGDIQRQLEGCIEDVAAALDLVEGLDEDYDDSDTSAILRYVHSAMRSLAGVTVDTGNLEADLNESDDEETEDDE